MRLFGHVPMPNAPKAQFYTEFSAPAPQKIEVLLHNRVRELTGKDMPYGYQKIGDCVSWGWSHLINYTAILAGLMYEPTATEVIYALSRVEVGRGQMGRQDGSSGHWASEAVTKFGSISREGLIRCGQPGEYDPSRAKVWGRQGLPDNLEPEAHNHILKSVTQVRSFMEAAFHIENQRVVPVCSDVGFENGTNGAITTRDEEGFARPHGSWPHCMCFVAVRWDRPGLLCINQWQPECFSGPVVKGQPHQSFWVDAHVCDQMLSQDDSYTGELLDGYPTKVIDWSH